MSKSISAILCVILLAACAGKNAVQSEEEIYAPAIDPADFVLVIDNPYMPLEPGTTYVYEGITENGNEHNEVRVLPETKEVMGITCVIVEDVVLIDGVLEEATFDWYAQDKQGNVWYFGEDSKEYYPDGSVASTEGSWEAGVDGALPGIIMKAESAIGDTYRQEYYKGEAEDWAAVLNLSESASLSSGTYDDLLVTNEWSGLDDPPIYEHKYYAKGIGLILTEYVASGHKVELLEMRSE